MSNVGRRGKLKLESRLRAALLNGTNTRLEHHEIERVIDALLKPPAREDAQPVAWLVTNRATGHEELFWKPLADLPFNRERFSTAPLYTHPAPDALRVAVDAVRGLYDQLHSLINGDEERELVWQTMRRIDKALSDMKANQKGGA